ncbi:GUN4 domain-containing protein [Calothrix sp. NIES-2098]|uniref:GUN4 domain-containing protein n=1 Tax=Calothrix sp. NIES-2098 TaxID=1954171 RepID=UPI000B5E2598|nr:serine/threonine protein kinase [Calothrix sp. NIES-2098]
MNNIDVSDWKTPLGYYERAIEELRRTKEELQDELETIKASNVQALESSIKSFQTEIHSLKSELQLTKEKLESAERTAIEAEKAANDAQAKIQNFKNSLPESTINFQIIEELAQIKGQVSQLFETNQKSPENDLQKEILESLSSLRSQFSQLEAELTLISPNSGINYTKLRDLLAEHKWQEADRETCIYMLRISDREDDKWLDDGEIKKLSRHDLRIINNLWLKYSDGKFGFSVQKQIWQDSDEDYKLFGHRVGWLVNLVNTEWRKYEEAIFSLDAPTGHLPYTIRVLGLGYRNPGELPHRLKRFLPRY